MFHIFRSISQTRQHYFQCLFNKGMFFKLHFTNFIKIPIRCLLHSILYLKFPDSSKKQLHKFQSSKFPYKFFKVLIFQGSILKKILSNHKPTLQILHKGTIVCLNQLLYIK